MGEHLPCKQGVKSSNLSISMKIAKSAAAAGRHRHPMDACVQPDGYGGRGMDDRRASMSEQSDFLCERSAANLTILLRTLKTAYRKQYLIDQISKTSEGNHRKVISNKVKVNNPTDLGNAISKLVKPICRHSKECRRSSPCGA